MQPKRQHRDSARTNRVSGLAGAAKNRLFTFEHPCSTSGSTRRALRAVTNSDIRHQSKAMAIAEFYVPGPLAGSRVDRAIGLRNLLVLCVAVATCCASFVFALLYNSDQSYPVTPVQHMAVSALDAVTTAHTDPDPSQHSTAPHRINFRLHRANMFQPVGPIRLRIWKIDARHDSVRVSILASDRRIDLNRVGVHERVVIPASPSQVELVFNEIDNNEVTGYITEQIGEGR
jgi:hypothetical protein